jgi:hypothetical protein
VIDVLALPVWMTSTGLSLLSAGPNSGSAQEGGPGGRRCPAPVDGDDPSSTPSTVKAVGQQQQQAAMVAAAS